MEGRDILLVVAYDGSPDADAAAAWAGRAAAAGNASVTAVVPLPPQERRGTCPAVDDPASARLVERARSALLGAGAPIARVTTTRAPLVEALVDCAAGASMVVVGSRAHGWLGQILLGWADSRPGGHAMCPVVVVRPAQDLTAHRIVVGSDGSMPSARALDFACRQAVTDQQVVVALRARSLSALPHNGERLTTRTAVRRLQEQVLHDVVAQARAAHPAVDVQASLVFTDPGRALVDASSRASLLVVGTRGLTATEGAVLGSISQYVVRHAHCSVAVVH